MSSQVWFNGAFTCALAAVILLLVQALWMRHRARRKLAGLVADRFKYEQTSSPGHKERFLLSPLQIFLLRSDLNPKSSQLIGLALVTGTILLMVLLLEGLVAFLVTALLLTVIVYVICMMRFQKKRQTIHTELPEAIDVALRYLDAGRSLEQALVEAFGEASAVFHSLKFRLRSAVDAGRDYTPLLDDFATLYKVPSMLLVALAIKTSSRFGSNVQPLLRQVSQSLRANQELRREFLASTAEIRFTAVTFSVLPPLLAAYMTLMNRQYADILLDSATGHLLLGVAGLLQLVGTVLIWRMISEVGRV